MKTILLIMAIYAGKVETCTPDLPGYNKPWADTGATPCEWAGYECAGAIDCRTCDILVAHCAI